MPNPANASVSNVDVSNIIDQSASAPAPDDTGTPAPAEAPTNEAAKSGDTPPATVTEDAPATLDLSEPVVAKSTGNNDFDAIGKLLADKGVANVNSIMDAFMESGEINLADKATMIEALGEGVANMAFKQLEAGAAQLISDAKADSAKSMDYANKLFGGKDAGKTWEEIKAYVRTPEAGFSEADLAAMNTMLAAGGLQAQLVIDKVYKVYNADPTVSTPGTLLEGDQAANGLTFDPISRTDYTAEMGKAVGKYGEDSHQVSALNRRRELSMARGF